MNGPYASANETSPRRSPAIPRTNVRALSPRGLYIFYNTRGELIDRRERYRYISIPRSFHAPSRLDRAIARYRATIPFCSTFTDLVWSTFNLSVGPTVREILLNIDSRGTDITGINKASTLYSRIALNGFSTWLSNLRESDCTTLDCFCEIRDNEGSSINGKHRDTDGTENNIVHCLRAIDKNFFDQHNKVFHY